MPDKILNPLGKRSAWRILVFLSILLFLLGSGTTQALTPIVQWNDLVAGRGVAGFKDGEFYSARFNSPSGLAVSADGGTLYLADRGNHRLRSLDLKNRNLVSTLAGTGVQGRQDGPALKASFNSPSLLSLLPNDRIAIWDQGNRLIRLLDLKTGILSTLVDLNLPNAQGGEVWNMVYFPPDGGLYFSQPAEGLLRRLDLKTGQVSNLLQRLPGLPHPSALAVFKGRLYVADQDSGNIFSLDITLTANAPAKVDPRQAGSASHILAMAATGNRLYAYQADGKNPIAKIIPPDGPLNLRSVWGHPVSYNNHFVSSGVESGWAAGFVADPAVERRFYITNSAYPMILSVQDFNPDAITRGNGTKSSELIESEYPEAKPALTFRILLLGRSYLFYNTPNSSERRSDVSLSPMELFAKKMELYLNTLAALEDSPWKYEVLNGGKINELPVYVWPYYEAPPLVEKFDVDLTVVMLDVCPDYGIYIQAPLTPEGIPPHSGADPEFMLKPVQKKFTTGLMKRFFDTGRELKLINVNENNKLEIAPFSKLVVEPRMEEILVEMKGKPLDLLNGRLKKIRAGKPGQPPLLACVFPLELQFDTEIESTFWAKTSRKYGFPLIDLSDAFTALRPTYYPYGEDGGGGHFGPNGHFLMSFLLTHELIHSGIIPFGAGGKSGTKDKTQP